ncbi:MAG: hypothetical protein LBC20_17955 [Planctomycetaceae bacterium]|jgi:hypothetical protein|nr:hypothetical protein [Planctomycetaceae bacterium]
MTSSFFRILTVCVFILELSVCVSAQDLGNLGNIGGGNIGNIGNTGGSGNTGSGGNAGNNNSSNSNSSSINSDSGSTSSDLGSTTNTPTFQGFQDTTSQTFIGRDSSTPFIGREEVFSDRQTSTNNKRTTTATSSTRATSSRMTSSRSMTSRSVSGRNSSSNGRTVRAVTQADVAFSPMEVNHRTTEFQTRITRLPSLHILPEQIGVKLENTSQGNVATLTGTVSSERERKIMKQLLLLEPGIDKVENKLSVSGN